MKFFKKAFIMSVALAMAIAITPAAQSNTKKTLYIISSISVKENGKTTPIKLSYNKNGLLKKIDASYSDSRITQSFYYDNSNQLTKRIMKGSDYGSKVNVTYLYTWKKGKLKKIVTDFSGNDTCTTVFKYNSQNLISSQAVTYSGDSFKFTTDFTKYKKGHRVKAKGYDKYEAGLDKKGNITYYWLGEYVGNQASIKYDKNGRVKTLKRTFTTGMYGSDKHTQNLNFSYKQISVPKKVGDLIAEQQWTLINNARSYNDVSFAW